MTVSPGCDDENLIGRIAGGDREAFQTLFDRRMGDVFRFSYSLLLDRQQAEDVTQEAFVRLWQNAGTWKPEASVKTWLLTIARNLCLDQHRKRKNEIRKYQGYYETQLPRQNAHAEGAGHRLDQEKHQKILQNALFSLPERQREAIALVYYMGIHNTEAARMMGLGAAAFDSLLARARKALRERLKRDGDDLKGYFYGTE